MIENAFVYIYAPVVTKDAEGAVIKTWGYRAAEPSAPLSAFRGDVQPHTLSAVEMAAWGLSNRTPDTKRLFFAFDATIKVPNRAIVVSDFDTDAGVYEIVGVNRWPGHGTAILIPVQGEPDSVMSSALDEEYGRAYLWDDFSAWNDEYVWKDGA